MPPQSNPNWRHLEEYEQIKRKNRRRLVGALLLTTVVALLLAKVMGSSKNTAAPGEITVSGGIASMTDIEALDGAGLRSVIVGKALYEGRITLKDLARCLPNA